MLELIAKTGLLLGSPKTLACIAAGGALARQQTVVGRILLLYLFTMIYNVYLKSIWQVPLPAPLEGWAFPSGHMHTATIFWGASALAFRKVWFTAFTFLILSFVGYALVYFGYHYPIDIVGAVGFAGLTLCIYQLLLNQPLFKDKPYCLGFLLITLAFIFIQLTPLAARKMIQWQAFGGMIFVTLGWMLIAIWIGRKTISQKIVTKAG